MQIEKHKILVDLPTIQQMRNAQFILKKHGENLGYQKDDWNYSKHKTLCFAGCSNEWFLTPSGYDKTDDVKMTLHELESYLIQLKIQPKKQSRFKQFINRMKNVFNSEYKLYGQGR